MQSFDFPLIGEDKEYELIEYTNKALSENKDSFVSRVTDVLRIEGHEALFKTNMGGLLWVSFENISESPPVPTRAVTILREKENFPLIDALVNQKESNTIFNLKK